MAIDLPSLDELDQPPVAAADLDQADQPPQRGSLQERLHARREELQSNQVEIFDIPGYEGVLAASYQILPWKTHRTISARHEKQGDVSLRELYTAADTLVNACVDLHEVTSGGERRPLGYKWGTRAAVDLFGVTASEAGDTARQGLLASFPRDALIIAHYGQIMEWQQGVSPRVDEELEGESEAGSPTA